MNDTPTIDDALHLLAELEDLLPRMDAAQRRDIQVALARLRSIAMAPDPRERANEIPRLYGDRNMHPDVQG